MAKTRFIYIAGYLKQTVTDSQVIGWLETYQQRGINFDLLLIAGIRPYFKDRAIRKTKIAEANEKLKGTVYDVFSVKPTLPLYQVIVFFILLGILAKDMVAGSCVVIQIRSASANSALKWLKKIYPNLKVIYDVRGATAEEYVNKFQRHGASVTRDVEKTYIFRLNQELELLDICDKAFFVSQKLRDYFLSKMDLPACKIEVIPGCADETSFRPDAAAREHVRSTLGIGGEMIVLLYSGGLNQPWQIPDFVFDLVVGLQRCDPRVFFMCLTPNQDIVVRYVEKLNVDRDRVWSDYVSYDEINDYLNAADFGLLLREDTPTNNVASPTKFAEYLMAGVPVLISRGIGDLSDFVEQHPDAGLVIDNDSELLVDSVAQYVDQTEVSKDVTAELGRKNFSKSEHLEQIIGVYESFC